MSTSMEAAPAGKYRPTGLACCLVLAGALTAGIDILYQASNWIPLEIGAHILSGAVMDLIALNELFPNWKELGAPSLPP